MNCCFAWSECILFCYVCVDGFEMPKCVRCLSHCCGAIVACPVFE